MRPILLVFLLASACAPDFNTGDWTADGGVGDVPADSGGQTASPLGAILHAERLTFGTANEVAARVAFRGYPDAGGVPSEPALPGSDQCELRDDPELPEGVNEEAGAVKVSGLASSPTTMTFDSAEGAYVLPEGTFTWPSGNITFDVTAGGRIPEFSAQLAAPAALALTAPTFPADDTTTTGCTTAAPCPVPLAVDRTQALHVAWGGAAATSLSLTLGVPADGASPGKTLVCAPGDDGSFDVPAAKLALLPANREGFFALERRRNATVTATGVDQVSASASTVTKGVIKTSQ